MGDQGDQRQNIFVGLSTHRFQNFVKYLSGPRAYSLRRISKVNAAKKNHSASFTLKPMQKALTNMSKSNPHWKYLGEIKSVKISTV